ncbi:uncharacterized protein C7orf50 homolog [Chelmon rostratus]|uniref:uncharacterized protein C7orf50 homolog n=1 Tax=Chelmon rostratus TaxID=109905 RepID=UPI001BE80CD9|nr:uncharacterized protein C7orf50 homolog [Chelmon rostratus]XP_041818060.1 uncharacterized protein C7orf50 homolog [Chelmon rostratus]
MAKDKSLKRPANPPKRKKLTSLATKDHVEEMMDGKIQKKRKRMEVEVAPVQIPPATSSAHEKKQKKDKKHKNREMTEPTQKTKQTEISDPPCRPEGPHRLEGEEDLSPEEMRVLERKMKKILKKEEKKRLKAEGVTEKAEASGPTAPQQALDYLTCWNENREEWKFQKTRQTWLLQHMFDSDKIPDEKFSVLLQYLEGLRGGARDTTAQKALALVEESGQAPEDSAVQQRAHRAREVIQLLS